MDRSSTGAADPASEEEKIEVFTPPPEQVCGDALEERAAATREGEGSCDARETEGGGDTGEVERGRDAVIRAPWSTTMAIERG